MLVDLSGSMARDGKSTAALAGTVLLVEALTRTAGNVTRAAREIDVSRPTLHDLVRKHGLDLARFRRPGLPDEVEEEEPGAP